MAKSKGTQGEIMISKHYTARYRFSNTNPTKNRGFSGGECISKIKISSTILLSKNLNTGTFSAIDICVKKSMNMM
jgi:hypothetical protein